MGVPTLGAVEAAERTIEHINEHRRLWHQGEWVERALGAAVIEKISSVDEAVGCGTSCCFAGWFVLFDGQEIRARTPGSRYFVVVGGDLDMPTYASARLGLPNFGDWPGRHPFDAGMNLAALEEWVAALRECAETSTDVLDHPICKAGRLILEEQAREEAGDDA